MRLKYLVTGTGRSGTVFMARLLTSVGIPCGHEMFFDHHGLPTAVERLTHLTDLESSWASRTKYVNGKWVPIDCWLDDPKNVEAESSYMAAPFLTNQTLLDVPVIHVIRDPIKVINSFCNYIDFFKYSVATNHYEEFVYSHVPELTHDLSQYDRAALYWVRWNQMVEAHKPALVHRIEDGSEQVLQFLGKTGPCFDDKTINSFKKTSERFCVDRIKNKNIFDEFVSMGRRYGYPMQSEYLLI